MLSGILFVRYLVNELGLAPLVGLSDEETPVYTNDKRCGEAILSRMLFSHRSDTFLNQH